MTIKHPWNILLILCAVFLVFSPALKHPFVQWDDDVHCYNNPNVRGLDAARVKAIFTTDVNNTYIPLTIFSFALEYHFFKDHPMAYHLDNILLHLGVVLMLYLVALRLGISVRAAALSALLFGIHPMHVESVAWVTQRKDVLYSFFYLLSCWHYLGFLENRRAGRYWAALLFGFLSILAKPMALSLPLVLLLLEWYRKGQLTRASWLDKIPFALIVFPLAWVTYQMNMRTVDLSLAQAPLVWLWSLSFYIGKFFVPHELLALYQPPLPVSLHNTAITSGLLVVAVTLAALVLLRRNRLFVFAWVYFFLSIFFLLRFDYTQDLSFVADRFMYLPSLGLCLWLGVLADQEMLIKDKLVARLTIILSAVVLILWAGLAHKQTKLWGNEYLMWFRVAEKYPSAAAFNHLGNYFLGQQDYAQALTYYDQGIAIDPRYHKTYGNRGVIHLREGNFDAAIADFTLALALNPSDATNAYNNRGYAYARIGDIQSALANYNRAIELDPNNFKAYMNRATIFKDRGQFSRALDDLHSAHGIDPDDKAVQSNIEWLRRRMNDVAL